MDPCDTLLIALFKSILTMVGKLLCDCIKARCYAHFDALALTYALAPLAPPNAYVLYGHA